MNPQVELRSSPYRLSPYISQPDSGIMNTLKEFNSNLNQQRNFLVKSEHQTKNQGRDKVTTTKAILHQDKFLRGEYWLTRKLPGTLALTEKRKPIKDTTTNFPEFQRNLVQDQNISEGIPNIQHNLISGFSKCDETPKTMTSEREIKFENKLKISCFECVGKLDKFTDDKIGGKCKMSHIKNVKSRVNTLTSTNLLSPLHVSTYKEPAKLRLKRLNYEYQLEEDSYLSTKKTMMYANCNLLSAQKNNNGVTKKASTNAEFSLYGYTTTIARHVLETSKKELCLFDCVFNLKFATRVGQIDHTKMLANEYRQTESHIQNKMLKIQLKSHY